MTNTPTAAPSSGRSPWVTAIVIGFALMIAVNAAFIWIAVRGQDPVVPSYSTESR
ncbi:MAG TPA: hypothetical protein VFX50_05395 [Gemmatimonadales bacterium]|jgi:nitrogen fixation protein FixH|nr:hypothetical protein [Gemmatimonadales bacterium]